jgi:serine protease Do
MSRLDKLVVGLFFGVVVASLLFRLLPFENDPSSGRRPLPPPAADGAPSPPREAAAAPQRARRPLPPPSPGDPIFSVGVADQPPGTVAIGTSFGVGRGLWLTARHVANAGCARVIMAIDGAKILAEIAYLHPEADLAVLRTRSRPTPILPLSTAEPRSGATGFSFGFPSGSLGGAEGTLMGRARMQLGGRLVGTAPVLAWAEVRRFPAALDSLGGISGGPMLDEDGTVIGISVAASQRRGRIYTVAPEILHEIAAEVPAFRAGRSEAPAPEGRVREVGVRPVSIIDVATALNRSARIAKTACVPS